MLKFKPSSLNLDKFRPFLVPVLIVVVIVLSGLFLVKPWIGKAFEVQENLRKEGKRLSQLTEKTSALESLSQTDLAKRADAAAKALPSEKDLSLFLVTLRTLATRNNLEIVSLQVSPGEIASASAEANQEALPLLSFQVKAGGYMNDLLEFLDQAAHSAPIIVVQGMDVEGLDLGGRFELSLVIDFPFLPLPTSLGRPEKALPQTTSQEEEIYQKLAQLEFLLGKEVLPLVPSGKENPFAF
jgi:hypothetical protein